MVGRSAVSSGLATRRWHLGELVGRWLIVAGLLVLAFVGFQLWGTGVAERQAQRDLAAELRIAIEQSASAIEQSASAIEQSASARSPGRSDRGLASATPRVGFERILLVGAVVVEPVAVEGSASPGVITIPYRDRPDSGSAVARIEAPTIGLDKTVVEGVGRPQLGSGPGLYPISPLPGHEGNVAIAGHRTTHGAPFADLDQLEPGDPITLETVDGRFIYHVEAVRGEDGNLAGHRIVDPGAVDVIAERGDNRLTLTSCHPRYSNRQRLVVSAVLYGPAVAFLEPEGRTADPNQSPDRLEAGLGSGLQPPMVGAPTVDGGRLDQPLGWQWAKADWVVFWLVVTLIATTPGIALYRRRRRFLAAVLLAAIAVYPILELMTSIDMFLPAI